MSIKLILAAGVAIILLVLTCGWYYTGQQLKQEHTKRVAAEATLKDTQDAFAITRSHEEALQQKIVVLEAKKTKERIVLGNALDSNPDWAKAKIPQEVLDALK